MIPELPWRGPMTISDTHKPVENFFGHDRQGLQAHLRYLRALDTYWRTTDPGREENKHHIQQQLEN